MKKGIYLFYGIVFGIILTKAEVISWFRIRKMFLFEEPRMYLIIGSAVVVGIISVLILKTVNARSVIGDELNYTGKKFNKGFIIGGFLFGIGWAITGACPGPIFAQIGAGEYPALVSLAGAVTGAYLYNTVKLKLPH
jgi:hypothetical protein